MGERRVPGDKAISHRAAILGALAEGTTVARGFSSAGDCRSTLEVLAALGVAVEREGDVVRVAGRAGRGFPEPRGPLDCGRSATTMRLMAGALAASPHRFDLTGDPQLLRRPMDRVADPLRRLGARVEVPGAGVALRVRGGPLRGVEYRLAVASAQVKACVLLAGIQAEGETVVVEAVPTRDHTERLLEAMGVEVRRSAEGGQARIGVRRAIPRAIDLSVPGDFSSAAFLVAAATLVPGSDLVVRGVGLNPSRLGFLRVLERMGGRVEVSVTADGPEPAGDLRVRHASLVGTAVGPEEVPAVIDELPLIGLLGARAEGVTEVRGAGELRVKESDRISGLVEGLRALGVPAEEAEDGFVVRGPAPLSGGVCDARGDHRLAMTFLVAGLVARGPVRVRGSEYVGDSFPEFAGTVLRPAGERTGER